MPHDLRFPITRPSRKIKKPFFTAPITAITQITFPQVTPSRVPSRAITLAADPFHHAFPPSSLEEGERVKGQP